MSCNCKPKSTVSLCKLVNRQEHLCPGYRLAPSKSVYILWLPASITPGILLLFKFWDSITTTTSQKCMPIGQVVTDDAKPPSTRGRHYRVWGFPFQGGSFSEEEGRCITFSMLTLFVCEEYTTSWSHRLWHLPFFTNCRMNLLPRLHWRAEPCCNVLPLNSLLRSLQVLQCHLTEYISFTMFSSCWNGSFRKAGLVPFNAVTSKSEM